MLFIEVVAKETVPVKLQKLLKIQEEYALLSHELLEQCLKEVKSHYLLEKPTLSEILELLEPLIDWESLARCLSGITEIEIDQIKEKTDIESQKSILISKWLQTEEASWKQFVVALVKCVNAATLRLQKCVDITTKPHLTATIEGELI